MFHSNVSIYPNICAVQAYKFCFKKIYKKAKTSTGEEWVEVNGECMEVDEQEWQKLLSIETLWYVDGEVIMFCF